ncbi:MAG: hypothetical protein EOO43_07020 [Flavobacterium sp.]|nr:MAG: hypothetical protein EOO43_07020 [Flavobacterium sp.]
MKKLEVSTKDPLELKEEIEKKILAGKISSWELDENRKLLSHKGQQYRSHFYFEYIIDNDKGILEFLLRTNGTSDFAESKALQLLERMLEAHFSDVIKIIK